MKVVICEKCYNIPKIVILNKGKIKIDCINCNESRIEEYSYFDKFINNKNAQLFELNPCNYENHEISQESSIYCFQCDKYICESCLNNIHNKNLQTKKHSTTKQKIKSVYYCKQPGHEEYILDHYCTKCNIYLCSKCSCSHLGSDIFTFEKKDNEINEIRNKLKKGEEIIKIEEIYLKKYIKRIQDKIDILEREFIDFKKRNLNSISIYNLLIDNYEQTVNKVKNFNIYNNININDNFNLNESTVYYDECLMSTYNRLSAYYTNTNFIKTKEYTNYYITEKYCNKKIKKCIMINNNIIAYIFENSLKNISFVYKLKEVSSYLKKDIFFDNFIKDIYPLNRHNFFLLDHLNNLDIVEIKLENNSFGAIIIKSFKNINYILSDKYNNNNFFMMHNDESFFNIGYCSDDSCYENINLISKENKKFIIKNIFNDINTIIDNSIIDKGDKELLKGIFTYMGKDDENLEKLNKVNNNILKFFDRKNKDFYNEMKDKINENEQYYLFNSNYIYKTFKRLNNITDNDNLDTRQKKYIEYIANFNKICGDIIEKYINYYVFNYKINNIYNYKNAFLIFMGENYLINIYSLKLKRFFPLSPINFFNAKYNFKDFEIILIASDKVVLNDSSNRIIYFIENNKNYNFCLLRTTFFYHTNATADNNYLLVDKIIDNELQFSFIDLSDLSNKDIKLINLLNFKINYNIPKIVFNGEFKKLIYVYENNQLCIMDYIYEQNLKNNNDIRINQINLQLDNQSEIIPPISEFSSIYNNDYKVQNLFVENNYYYCSKNNKNESLLFDFEKEYCFNRIVILYIDRFKKERLKQFKIVIGDKDKRWVHTQEYSIDRMEDNYLYISLNNKGRYIKFELLENFGGYYFIIGRMQFFVEQIYSIQ